MTYQLFELHDHQSFFRRLFWILQRWLIITIISLFIVAVINWILLKFWISIEDQSRLVDWVWSRNRKQVLLQVIIVGPIIEELMFRSWITIKRYRILLCWIVIWWVLFKNWYHYSWWIILLIWIIISWLIYFHKIVLKKSYISYAIIVSSVVFGLVHINNFKGFHWWEILIVIPQLLLWFLLWKVRVAYWLHYAVFLHIFHNWIVWMWIVAAKYLNLWPMDETIISKSWLAIFWGFCMIYYWITLGSIIISFFYHNDIIKSNDHKEEYQPIK